MAWTCPVEGDDQFAWEQVLGCLWQDTWVSHCSIVPDGAADAPSERCAPDSKRSGVKRSFRLERCLAVPACAQRARDISPSTSEGTATLQRERPQFPCNSSGARFDWRASIYGAHPPLRAELPTRTNERRAQWCTEEPDLEPTGGIEQIVIEAGEAGPEERRHERRPWVH